MAPESMARSVALPADSLVGRTLASDVLHRLRADIVASCFLPRERLRFEALRDRYGASFGTLREALAHLVHEGIVVAEGQRGFRVAPITRAELDDLVQVRMFIERETLRRSFTRRGEAWRAAVAETYRQLDAARQAEGGTGGGESDAWHDSHRRFHLALVGACDSPTLLDMRNLLWQRLDRYRTLARRLDPQGAGAAEEHDSLYEAAMAGDEPRIQALVEAQIRHFGELMRRRTGPMLEDG